MTDTKLLEAFAESRSEKAFDELVRRYVNLVYSAATRILVDPQLAEDATQSAFVALAQNPVPVQRKLRSGAPLSAWLHVTTRNIAAKTVRTEERRRKREREAAAVHQLDQAANPITWEQISPCIDAALAGLRDIDRSLLLLRFFEQKSVRELAERFGAREEAMQKRLTRALESLRNALVHQGVNVSSAAALAALLSANAIQAAPASILASTASAAIASAHLVASGTASLWINSFGTIVMTKSQVAVTLGLVVGFAIPFTLQQTTLRELRAAAAPGPEQVAIELRQVDPAPERSVPNEAEEIQQLRQRAAELRAQLAARKAATSPRENKFASAAPVLLGIGRAVSIFDLAYAGNDTPEAALQSFLAFSRDGNLEGALTLTLMPPSDLEEMNQALQSEEMRELFRERLQGRLLGAVVSESVQQFEDGSTSGPVVRDVWPENPSGEVRIEILEREEIDEKRVRVSFKIVRGQQEQVEYSTFGRTRNGWKHLTL